MTSAWADELSGHGFATVPSALDAEALARLLAACRFERGVTSRAGVVYAARYLLQQAPELELALAELGLHSLASEALGAPAAPIDATFFDKLASANWGVPAHQDRVHPVAEGGEGARQRGGVTVADLDASTLAAMVALRVHFDAADEGNGALSVLPGSHRRGLLDTEALRALARESFVPCCAEIGDVLLMRPLLVHRSPRSRTGSRRRVLHVVYGSRALDERLTRVGR